MKKFLLVMVAGVALGAPPVYKVVDKIKIGGGGPLGLLLRRHCQPPPVRVAWHADRGDRHDHR